MRTNRLTRRPGELRLRVACTALIVALWIIGGKMQSGIDPALLKRLFPAAASFSPKGGDPPHVKALMKVTSTIGATRTAQLNFRYGF